MTGHDDDIVVPVDRPGIDDDVAQLAERLVTSLRELLGVVVAFVPSLPAPWDGDEYAGLALAEHLVVLVTSGERDDRDAYLALWMAEWQFMREDVRRYDVAPLLREADA